MHTERGGKEQEEEEEGGRVPSWALRHRDFTDTLGTSAGLCDWWRLNVATRPKLGSHSSICNKTPDVGMTRRKSTLHESHPGVIFSIICLPSACLLRRSEMCSRDAHHGQEALRPEGSVLGSGAPGTSQTQLATPGKQLSTVALGAGGKG